MFLNYPILRQNKKSMRIEGYIEHPNMKITVFKMDNKYSVKFETPNYEQTYKLRTGNLINSLGDVKEWVDAGFMTSVLSQFNNMHEITMERNAQRSELNKDEFEKII